MWRWGDTYRIHATTAGSHSITKNWSETCRNAIKIVSEVTYTAHLSFW